MREPTVVRKRLCRPLQVPGSAFPIFLQPLSPGFSPPPSESSIPAHIPDTSPATQPWIETALAELPCKQAPLTHNVALATMDVELPHRDPADRWPAATARVFGLKLVTADRQLLVGHGYETVRAA